MDLKKIIRDVPDFPEKGIIFRDITPLLQNSEALRDSIFQYEKMLEGVEFDYIVGPESRGFIFGVPLAFHLNKGFIPVRKVGKLPFETISKDYDLEYGSATIEIHKDAIKKGDRVVIVDDLLATGGTCKAMIDLIEEAGGIVEKIAFLIELKFLNGKDKLEGYNVESLVTY